MIKHKYFIMVVIINLVLMMSNVSAQIFYNADDHISITTPANWINIQNYNVGKGLHNLIFVRNIDNDACVMLNVDLQSYQYNTLKDLSVSDRKILCNYFEKIMTDFLEEMGFNVSLNGSKINEKYIMLGFTCTQNRKFVFVTTYFIRNHHPYMLSYMSPPEKWNVRETVDVVGSIKIDGIDIADWIP